MNTYVVLRKSAWGTPDELEAAAGRSSRALEEMPDKIRWIRSYIMTGADGRMGSTCIFQGVNEAAIEEHAQKAQIPADEILSVADTVVVNDDPK